MSWRRWCLQQTRNHKIVANCCSLLGSQAAQRSPITAAVRKRNTFTITQRLGFFHPGSKTVAELGVVFPMAASAISSKGKISAQNLRPKGTGHPKKPPEAKQDAPGGSPPEGKKREQWKMRNWGPGSTNLHVAHVRRIARLGAPGPMASLKTAPQAPMARPGICLPKRENT